MLCAVSPMYGACDCYLIIVVLVVVVVVIMIVMIVVVIQSVCR